MYIGINIANHRDLTQITADLLQIQALGAAHVVLSTQTNDMARFRWEIETLAAHVIPHVR